MRDVFLGISGFDFLSCLQDFFSFQASEFLQPFDEAEEDEATNDEKGDSDDKVTPAGDAADVFIVEFSPVFCMRVEVMHEVVGEAEVEDGGEAEGTEE